ncbi:T9SS C-terminal target domain-containing protein [bacterium]|nr:MAG: T9SS C-terminal target domain-containing protein [bacterium]
MDVTTKPIIARITMRSLMKIICTIGLLCAFQALHAQITITQSDVPAVGQTLQYESVPGLVEVNLGAAGPNQTWVLPDYDWDAPYPVDVINPSTTPYANDFPTANRCLYGFNDDFGVEGLMYNYQRIAANGVYYLGLVVLADTLTQTFIFPNEAFFAPLPLTYGASWTTVSYWEVEWNGFQVTRVDSSVKSVDAWGTVQTEEGNFATLRVYSQNWSTLHLPSPLPPQTVRDISFTWFSDEGVAGLQIESLEGVTSPTFTQGYVSAVRIGTENTKLQRGPLATTFEVRQNYPNPFNPTTNLPISLEQAANVEVTVYNELGEVVSREQHNFSPGNHKIGFDGSAWASGNYFARVKAGGQLQTMRMILVK